MGIFLLLYIVNSILLLFLGYFFAKKYRKVDGKIFFLFSLSTSLWFIFYILSYDFTTNTHLIEYFIKLSYFLVILALYSFLLFLIFFSQKRRLSPYILPSFFIVFSGLAYLYIQTPIIIDGLVYHSRLEDWYEVPGIGYGLHLVLCIAFIILFFITSHFTNKRLSNIEKKRFFYIYTGMLFFTISCFGILLILPIFDIYFLEKYVSFFLLPFILGVFYSIRKYEFLDTKILLTRFFTILYCFLCSYFVVKSWDIYSPSFILDSYEEYWGFSSDDSFISVLLGVSTFYILYSIIQTYIVPNIQSENHKKFFDMIKLQIPFLTDVNQLNYFIDSNFRSKMNIDGAYVETDISKISQELHKFLDTSVTNDYAINDYVFLEENKLRLSRNAFLNEKWYLCFPIKNSSGSVIAILYIGYKHLRDPFLSQEISLLQDFTKFLSGHLKYLGVYRKMQDLSIDLDRKVDEKTIEYNNLISKQKEFIRYASHEIKNPVTNSLFLSDDIREQSEQAGYEKVREDADILYRELLKVSELIKTIFDTERFDLQKISLYKRSVDIAKLLREECEIFQERHSQVRFDVSIPGTQYIHEVDEVQFRQVIINILVNALKFGNKNKPCIYVKLEVNSDDQDGNMSFVIRIEDNGKGLDTLEAKNVFEKYATGSGTTIGLGMGLYLCKKIIELHGGKIYATGGTTLPGASFVINL